MHTMNGMLSYFCKAESDSTVLLIRSLCDWLNLMAKSGQKYTDRLRSR